MSNAITRHVKQSLTTILPTRKSIQSGLERYPLNPLPSLAKLTLLQWQLFFLGLWMWILDSASFFSVSLTSHYMVDQFDKSIVDINHGIMYSLFTRVLGALIFGIYSDMFSRKWAYVVICSLLCIIQLGTSFVQTFNQFLACRCIFGLILGASFSVGNVTAVENINGKKDKNSKDDIAGILSGVFQAGYPIGYLIAQGAVRGLVENTHSKHTWRILYWFTSGLCVPFIFWRMLLPESPIFLETKTLEKKILQENNITKSRTRLFWDNFSKAFTKYWDKILYQCFFMGAFCYISHGSQDLFPTLLSSLKFTPSQQSTINILANVGCICGSLIGSHLANYLGIRFTILVGVVIGCCVIYPWGYVRNGKIASAFFLQFAVQFGFSNVPKYLHELSSYGEMKVFATVIIGFAYQFGTLVSAPSSTIQSKIAAGNNNDYAATMSIFLAIAFVCLFIIVLFGIENRDGDSYTPDFVEEGQIETGFESQDKENSFSDSVSASSTDTSSSSSSKEKLNSKIQHIEV